MKEWRCRECDHQVVTIDDHKPEVSWSDGHVCKFEEIKEEEEDERVGTN